MEHFTFNFGTRFFNLLTIVGALLFSVGIWAQPTVDVPPACNVVVAGSGGTTGFGGTVGSGGIIIMPDPYNYGTFTINQNGTSANSWFLLGDLSIAPNTYGNSAIQSLTGSTTANIMSFNKDVRQSESASLARSIGRVTIPYDDSLCSSSIYFTVYKQYSDSLPPIVGPDCWLPDSTYTYSVDQIASDNLPDGIGLDMYYWTVKDQNNTVVYDSRDPNSYPNFQIYTSADKSSITVQAPSTLNSPYTITCCFGRANPWDGDLLTTVHTSCVSKIIGASPVAPTLSMPNCIDIGANSFSITVSPYNPNYTYNWTSSNPQWLITPITGGANVTGLGYGSGIISLEVGNAGCSSVIVSDTVYRGYNDSIVSIVGDTCVSSNSTHNYHISPIGVQANTNCWVLPSGWTYNSLNNTNSDIDITIPPSAPSGSYVLKAYSCKCPNDTVYLTVRVRPDDPTKVTGSTCINYGNTNTITYTVSPAGNYQWSLPPGWTGSSTTETIVVTPTGNTVGQVIATGVDTSGMGCNSLNPAIWNVDFNPIDPDTAIVGCINVGINGTTTVTIGNAPSPFVGTYVVTVTPSDLFASSPTINPSTGEITLYTSASASSTNYTLHIQHQTSCGTSTTLNVPITYGSGASLMMAALPSSDLYYISPAVPGASTYDWFLDGTPHPNTGPTLSLYGTNTPPDTVCVNVTDINGCVTHLCVHGGTYSALILGSDDNGKIKNNNIKVFPNPNNGEFVISIDEISKTADLTLIDMKGAIIFQNKELIQGNNRITNKNLVTGSYILIIRVDGQSYAKKIVIH